MKAKKRIKQLERRVEKLEALVHFHERARYSDISVAKIPLSPPWNIAPPGTGTPLPMETITIS